MQAAPRLFLSLKTQAGSLLEEKKIEKVLGRRSVFGFLCTLPPTIGLSVRRLVSLPVGRSFCPSVSPSNSMPTNFLRFLRPISRLKRKMPKKKIKKIHLVRFCLSFHRLPTFDAQRGNFLQISFLFPCFFFPSSSPFSPPFIQCYIL